MSKRLVHVARDGKVLGQYPTEQLSLLMDSGQFLPTDLCYSDACPEWTPMPEFLKKIQVPKYTRARQVEGSASGESFPRSGHRSGHHTAALLSGWIAFLLMLSAVIGSGFWILTLYSEIARKDAQLDEAGKKLAEKEKENQRLLFVSREVAEAGIVRGSIILRNEAGKRVAMPGIEIYLYPRKVIEGYLDSRTAELGRLPSGTNVDGNDFYTTNLPSPLASTSTDSSGRFEFSVPDPAEYVLVSRINSTSQAGAQVSRIWFVGFNSQDPLNTLVQITESNCVQQFVPSLMIVEGR